MSAMSEVGPTKVPSWAGGGGAHPSPAVEHALQKAIELGLLKAICAPLDTFIREGRLLNAALAVLSMQERSQVHQQYLKVAPLLAQSGLIIRLP
jgi:hypothetical protein